MMAMMMMMTTKMRMNIMKRARKKRMMNLTFSTIIRRGRNSQTRPFSNSPMATPPPISSPSLFPPPLSPPLSPSLSPSLSLPSQSSPPPLIAASPTSFNSPSNTNSDDSGS